MNYGEWMTSCVSLAYRRTTHGDRISFKAHTHTLSSNCWRSVKLKHKYDVCAQMFVENTSVNCCFNVRFVPLFLQIIILHHIHFIFLKTEQEQSEKDKLKLENKTCFDDNLKGKQMRRFKKKKEVKSTIVNMSKDE